MMQYNINFIDMQFYLQLQFRISKWKGHNLLLVCYIKL